jgi:HAD superfamily hydrolase (TIGR01509 family)
MDVSNCNYLKIPAGTPLLFDMDGTLIDNMMVHHRAWQQLLAELGLHLTLQEVKQAVWGKNEDIFERIFPGRFTAEEARMLGEGKERKYIEVYRDQIKMVEGLEHFLCAASDARCPMAIATAAPRICVDFVFESLTLSRFFSVVVHADQVVRSKPHPDPYLKAAELLGVRPEDCIVFEDAPVGIRASEAARMPSYVLLTTHSEEEFSDFPGILGFATDFRSFSIE